MYANADLKISGADSKSRQRDTVAMNDLDDSRERRDYRILAIFIWVVGTLGAVISGALFLFGGPWWCALLPIAFLVSLPQLLTHLTGYERHQRALKKNRN